VDRCDDCAFEYDAVPRAAIAGRLRDAATRYTARLGALDDAALRVHPVAGAWSALEYACHVRDIFWIQTARVRLALNEWEPSFEPMRRDERALEERYNDQPIATVASDLHEGAAALADTFDGLSSEEWQRCGFYNWPTRQLRTVEWIGRHTVHEAEHHWRDIEHLVGPSGASR
jgi:hypothetical protein